MDRQTSRDFDAGSRTQRRYRRKDSFNSNSSSRQEKSERSTTPSELNNPRELRALSFINPGKFMEDFDPERSSREMRKMNRRIYRDGLRKNQLYDDTGRFLDDSSDICDCTDLDCPGCHFPCPKCGSEKCGTQCRCNRQWSFEQIEIEGTSKVIRAIPR